MPLIGEIAKAVNTHIDEVFELHRLRYVYQEERDYPPPSVHRNFWLVCVCDEDVRMDRSTFNDHMHSMLMVGGLDPIRRSDNAQEPAQPHPDPDSRRAGSDPVPQARGRGRDRVPDLRR